MGVNTFRNCIVITVNAAGVRLEHLVGGPVKQLFHGRPCIFAATPATPDALNMFANAKTKIVDDDFVCPLQILPPIDDRAADEIEHVSLLKPSLGNQVMNSRTFQRASDEIIGRQAV